jgi:hypothetical protein
MKAKLFFGTMVAIGLSIAVATLTTATPGNKSELDNAMRNLGYTIIPIRKTALNEYEVKATLNGSKPIDLLLSFQATSTLFNTRRLDELGVSYEGIGQEFEINGDSDDAYMVRTDSINIGDGKLGPEEIMCLDFREYEVFEQYRVAGILGRDFLIKYNALIDFAEQKLYLKTK